MRAHRMAVFGCTALLALGAAACGDSDDDDGRRRGQHARRRRRQRRHRTSSAPPTRWSRWTRPGLTTSARQQLIGNIYQNLLSVPAGGNKPEPDAAESCDCLGRPKTYVCKLKPDLKFSSGDPLTSEDVKFSLDRMLKIEDPSGPSTLLGSLDSVEATDPTTVTMKLKKVDATWPFILTHNVAAIVPDEIYPADAKQPDDKAIGSGPYKLDKYTPNQQAVLLGQPELHRRRTRPQTPNVHRAVLRAGLGAEAGDRAG